MKTAKLLFLVVIALAITSFKTITSDSKIAVPSREFYQIKTYILNTEQQVQTTDKFLKEAYLPGLKKLGIKNIGVFKPKPNVHFFKNPFPLSIFHIMKKASVFAVVALSFVCSLFFASCSPYYYGNRYAERPVYRTYAPPPRVIVVPPRPRRHHHGYYWQPRY